MQRAVLGSGLVHLALLVVLFVVRTNAPMIVPGSDVVQVSLVDPSNLLTMPARAVPPAPKAPEKAAVAPDEESGVRLQKPEKPKPQPEKPPEEPRAEETPTLPYASVGNAGLKGSVGVDATNFEFAYYLGLVRNRVGQNWSPPAGLVSQGKPLRAVVYFKIGRNGSVSAIKLETSSAQEFFDRTALRAVLISDPMPPLPIGFDGSDLGVHFGFEYETP